jgi:hypothetical protein
MSTHVWYASYGSNLWRRRFEHYLHGGMPAGGRRAYRGARDRSAPTGDRTLELPFALRFGGASRTWGGGMAFIDTGRRGRTLARAYRITADQFADVHAQENGGAADPADLSAVADGDQVVAGRGNYPAIVRCGTVDGSPVFTFTATRPPERRAPAPAYVRTIAAGLAESRGMAPAAITAYLRQAPAVAGGFASSELAAAVEAGVADAIVPPPRHSSPS